MGNVKDRRGVKYGLLTCVELTGGVGKDGTLEWRCRCDCGRECTATTAQLDHGDKKSCGCLRKASRPIFLGQRFGALTVIADEGEERGRHFWRCRCDCGNECVVSASKLNRGKKKSCGCLGVHRGPRDLTGERFGSLVVLGPAGKDGKKRLWRCQCDCGRETVVWQSNLLDGHTKSCGCLQRQTYRENLKLIDGTSVTEIEKRRQTPIRSNTSGYNGVYWNSRTGLWCAQITFKGKTYYLGAYSDIQDAVKARKKGEEMYDDFLAWYYAQDDKPTA